MATEQAWEAYTDQSSLAPNDTILVRSNAGGGFEILGKHVFAVRSAGGAADIEINGAIAASVLSGTVRAVSGAGLTSMFNNGSDGFLSTNVGSFIFQVPTGGSHIFQINSVNTLTLSNSSLLLLAGALGYGAGAGGAVTQATSRTTGVTLNKAAGAITLVSAAGSTAWQSFTVTNSAVGANDTVNVCQKSGTDLYEIHVTAVAAGSFRISFRTTGGITTEQPVFNFAVVKGAIA